MGRETGLEPVTSSLGICKSVENKEVGGHYGAFLTTKNTEKNESASETVSNGVNDSDSQAPASF